MLRMCRIRQPGPPLPLEPASSSPQQRPTPSHPQTLHKDARPVKSDALVSAVPALSVRFPNRPCPRTGIWPASHPVRSAVARGRPANRARPSPRVVLPPCAPFDVRGISCCFFSRSKTRRVHAPWRDAHPASVATCAGVWPSGIKTFGSDRTRSGDPRGVAAARCPVYPSAAARDAAGRAEKPSHYDDRRRLMRGFASRWSALWWERPLALDDKHAYYDSIHP